MKLSTTRYDDTPPPPAVHEVMKDGHWLVPPERRPAGWEAMGLSESVTAAADFAQVEMQAQGTCWQREKKVKPSAPIAATEQPHPPAGKWDSIIHDLMASGQSMLIVDIPSGMAAATFKNNLRATLMQRKATQSAKWSVRDDNGRVLIEKVGEWSGPLVSMKETRIEHRSTSVERTITVEASPEPAEAPPVVVDPAATVKYDPLKKHKSREMDHSVTQRLVNAALKIWGTPLGDPDSYDDQYEGLERAAEELQARRDSEIEAGALLDWIEMESPGIKDRCTEQDMDTIFETILVIATERRLREFWLVFYARDLRAKGDPWRADRVEEMLRPEDQAQLRAHEADDRKKTV